MQILNEFQGKSSPLQIDLADVNRTLQKLIVDHEQQGGLSLDTLIAAKFLLNKKARNLPIDACY